MVRSRVVNDAPAIGEGEGKGLTRPLLRLPRAVDPGTVLTQGEGDTRGLSRPLLCFGGVTLTPGSGEGDRLPSQPLG